MNKVILIGRLTNDPDIRATNNGEFVAKFTLAVNRIGAKEGQQQADFINCVAFRNTAEFFRNYVHKGMKMAVEGRIQTGSYTNNEGRKVYTTDVFVERSEFAESRQQGQQAPPQYQQQTLPTGGAPIPTQEQAPAMYGADGFMHIPDNIDDSGLPWNS